MGALAFEHHLLSEAGTSPNNGALPLIVYRGAIDVGGGEPEAAVERHFDSNGWGDGFRGDTFPFHHYHSIAHEVVGCARGAAQLQFGGPEGPVVDVQAGDAVLIPAGVVHCRLDDKPGYVSVGAYPPGQQPDLCVLSNQDAEVSNARGRYRGLGAQDRGRRGDARDQGLHRRGPAARDRPAGGRQRPRRRALAGGLGDLLNRRDSRCLGGTASCGIRLLCHRIDEVASATATRPCPGSIQLRQPYCLGLAVEEFDRIFDPWGPISSTLYETKDSDLVENTIANTGVQIIRRQWSKDDLYSHSTRIRALRRDIEIAYAQLDPNDKGRFAQIVVKALLHSEYEYEVREKLVDRLTDIGWTISDDGELTTREALIGERFIPPNSEFDAYVTIREVLGGARHKIILVDAYIGRSLLTTLKSLTESSIVVEVLTVKRNLKQDFSLELAAFTKQVTDISITVRTNSDFHDRFIVIDDSEFYHVGSSIKDAGNRAFMISRIQDRRNIEGVREAIAEAWEAGEQL